MAAGGVVAWKNVNGDGVATKTLGTDTRTKGIQKFTDANGDGVNVIVNRP